MALCGDARVAQLRGCYTTPGTSVPNRVTANSNGDKPISSKHIERKALSEPSPRPRGQGHVLYFYFWRIYEINKLYNA